MHETFLMGVVTKSHDSPVNSSFFFPATFFFAIDREFYEESVKASLIGSSCTCANAAKSWKLSLEIAV